MTPALIAHFYRGLAWDDAVEATRSLPLLATAWKIYGHSPEAA